jgi:hypothetical protein
VTRGVLIVLGVVAVFRLAYLWSVYGGWRHPRHFDD